MLKARGFLCNMANSKQVYVCKKLAYDIERVMRSVDMDGYDREDLSKALRVAERLQKE